MSCILIQSEDNKLIISESLINIEAENSECITIPPTPIIGCFIFESENSNSFVTENNNYIEKENSNCSLIIINPINSNPNKDKKDIYFSYTRKYGIKYANEDIFKYTNLK